VAGASSEAPGAAGSTVVAGAWRAGDGTSGAGAGGAGHSLHSDSWDGSGKAAARCGMTVDSIYGVVA
jgi:hypothetical protein